ncbi:class I fructose-bisphosphate aldolase [Sulfobacillus thermosulfidooxidans]|uniref:Fructose-bisphosphate aldolase, class I n=2 Tax=Sulfobacillus thermosulfidooxidans TaxID=28034 RepID=A0A1W1W977_SULTA|nr:fructose-bisphosphate aldolase [Sulfobacillus thermosulfidooxidans]OLZ10605.1 fructose-bisphosphate aldolase [Sulfobacillus thermosulfidooxidans]OLZ16830.1 fructose-bisphosphate aldolase [Sulfobacillus thermosulfidooxidans]OLZ22275.1 fructose-bisphosphate aldolase [Sulfobacillus thermosulfidooxidans]PSR26973.1 MAG: fructose-bisphosphate aldolase [Sulfobacillus thermosulfidooxidans]SMC02293.1 fructose-bisphosphate aldolase, class I [Sulfobacillus thermosulfidooxidans DSM 9293]
MATQEIRAHLDQLNLSTGKKARLYRLLYGAGPANGTLMILPIDQGLEHGPRDFLDAPESQDPAFQFRIALDGHFSAIACQIGLAEKYYADYAGQVPLILKLNGKTEIPSDDEPISPLNASVEDAVRLGADAVGYTLYVGSPRQDEDFEQFRRVREDADRYGLPVVVWSYPRGAAIEQKGGRDSIYAIDYAARVAQELGADVIKLNVPKIDPARLAHAPKAYQREWTLESAVQQIIRSAGRSLVIFAGGEKGSQESALEKARLCMECGATGLIFGRNVWQQSYHDAMTLSEQIHQLLANYPG